jgi:hypothetical protein
LWKELTPYFDPPYDRTKFRIHHWLEGHRFSDELKGGTLNIFPIKLIFAWVSENPKERSEFIASIAPQDIYENNNSVALELLKRYGDNIEVRRELLVSYIGGGWTGPESLHHEKKKNKLIELGKREDNLNLNLWISEFIKYLDDRIKDARLEEERDLFA